MVEVNNLTTISVKKKRLKEIVKTVLKEENIKENINLSIAFVGEEEIKRINKRYRSKDEATDVLSFSEEIIKDELGEIVICLDKVAENAKNIGYSFEKELEQDLIHGLLHLLGYDHEKSKIEDERMMEKQKKYFELVN